MHEPVLVNEVIQLLGVKEKGIYLDGTVGLGGHTKAILKIAPSIRVIGIDRDKKALEEVKKKFKEELNKRLYLYKGNFKDIMTMKKKFPVQKFQGALLDLGFSSFQLADSERGFSFQQEGPLDMRMDSSQKEKAFDIVNTLSEEKLADIFFQFGEERLSRQIAKAICQRRKKDPIQTTLQLSNLICEISPRWGQSIHPATRVFQALRIAVNEELEGLDEALKDIFQCLKEGGRLGVISFHSLEDRIVKQTFYSFENPCTCPSDFPKCVCGKKPVGKRITQKPAVPSDEEIRKNPRSRSAKLRVIERVK